MKIFQGFVTFGTVFAVPALAQSVGATQVQTANLAARVQVQSACRIEADDLNFGVYDTAATSARTGQTELRLRCTPGSYVTIYLSAGGSGNYNVRKMTGPKTLDYQLYRDAALNNPLNSGGAAFTLPNDQNKGQTVVYPVYGAIKPKQDVPPGDYLDTIIVTINY